MPFFQNVFLSDFEGNWVLGDRQHSPKFVVPGNKGRGDEIVVAWIDPPYDLTGADADGTSTVDTLEIIYALREPKNWATLSINIATGAAVAAAVTAQEIATNLAANAIFDENFIVELGAVSANSTVKHLKIKQRRPISEFRFYIKSGRAEEVLQFNARAGVAEMPTYFDRHTIAERFNYADSQNHLIELDPDASNVDADIIDNAVDARGISLGYDSTDVQEDWELLRGRSGIFNFRKVTVDGSDRITQIIEYPAGARIGDLAMKTQFSYTGANLNPDEVTEIPYTLQSGDLITP